MIGLIAAIGSPKTAILPIKYVGNALAVEAKVDGKTELLQLEPWESKSVVWSDYGASGNVQSVKGLALTSGRDGLRLSLGAGQWPEAETLRKGFDGVIGGDVLKKCFVLINSDNGICELVAKGNKSQPSVADWKSAAEAAGLTMVPLPSSKVLTCLASGYSTGASAAGNIGSMSTRWSPIQVDYPTGGSAVFSLREDGFVVRMVGGINPDPRQVTITTNNATYGMNIGELDPGAAVITQFGDVLQVEVPASGLQFRFYKSFPYMSIEHLEQQPSS